jgi:hypothetical protein
MRAQRRVQGAQREALRGPGEPKKKHRQALERNRGRKSECAKTIVRYYTNGPRGSRRETKKERKERLTELGKCFGESGAPVGGDLGPKGGYRFKKDALPRDGRPTFDEKGLPKKRPGKAKGGPREPGEAKRGPERTLDATRGESENGPKP